MQNEFVRKPRKLATIPTSKYEASKAVHENKKYWGKVFEEIDSREGFSDDFVSCKKLAEVLPADLFHRVCNTLQIGRAEELVPEHERPKATSPRRMLKEPFISFRTQLHIDRELESDTDVEYSSSGDDTEVPSCHKELLQKPVREQITWPSRYLQPEKEEEKSLITKSDEVTNRIAKEFCQYMAELGGNQQSQLFTPEAIKELFQVEFDTHIARGLQVVPKEIPAVLETVAVAANSPEKSQMAVLEREVTNDIIVERRPDVTRAFGTSIPSKKQWRSPNNNTKNLWRSSRHVPHELVTLKTVWDGITNLRSVREYCHWMIEHPEYRRAPYLRSLGMFDPVVLQARTTFDLNQHGGPHHVGLNLDNLKKRLG